MSNAKYLCMYVLKRIPNISLEELESLFSRCNLTTTKKGLKTILSQAKRSYKKTHMKTIKARLSQDYKEAVDLLVQPEQHCVLPDFPDITDGQQVTSLLSNSITENQTFIPTEQSNLISNPQFVESVVTPSPASFDTVSSLENMQSSTRLQELVLQAQNQALIDRITSESDPRVLHIVELLDAKAHYVNDLLSQQVQQQKSLFAQQKQVSELSTHVSGVSTRLIQQRDAVHIQIRQLEQERQQNRMAVEHSKQELLARQSDLSILVSQITQAKKTLTELSSAHSAQNEYMRAQLQQIAQQKNNLIAKQQEVDSKHGLITQQQNQLNDLANKLHMRQAELEQSITVYNQRMHQATQQTISNDALRENILAEQKTIDARSHAFAVRHSNAAPVSSAPTYEITLDEPPVPQHPVSHNHPSKKPGLSDLIDTMLDVMAHEARVDMVSAKKTYLKIKSLFEDLPESKKPQYKEKIITAFEALQ
ncbi:MAG: hypothetical protein ACI8Y7_000112 [Candidatus Woesearchaeota archaeon]